MRRVAIHSNRAVQSEGMETQWDHDLAMPGRGRVPSLRLIPWLIQPDRVLYSSCAHHKRFRPKSSAHPQLLEWATLVNIGAATRNIGLASPSLEGGRNSCPNLRDYSEKFKYKAAANHERQEDY